MTHPVKANTRKSEILMSDTGGNGPGTSMPDADILGSKLKQVAEGVLDELLDDPGPISQRIDAIKAIGTLHLGLRRAGDKLPSPDDEAPGNTLKDMRERVRAAGEGK